MNRQIWNAVCFLTCSIFVTALVCTLGQHAHGMDSKYPPIQKNTYTLCSDAPILPGYVVVKITSDLTCKFGMAYTITPAVDGLRICAETPIPSPFIIVREDTVTPNLSPCNGATRLDTIHTAFDGANICADSPIPVDWSYVQSKSSSGACGTLVYYELRRAVTGLRICSTSPYPDSLIIGAIEQAQACGMRLSFILKGATDGVQACSVTNIPTNYVVVSGVMGAQCDSYYTIILRMVYDGIVVCSFSPIPKHYVIKSTVPVKNCESYANGYVLKFIP